MADYYRMIYESVPIPLQDIMTTMQGWIYKRQRYGKYYQGYLKYLSSQQYSDMAEMSKIQNDRFIELLTYAIKHSAFYKAYYANVNIKDIKSISDIKLLPVLEKETVRRNIVNMYTLPEKKGIVTNTSGTTGTPIKFIFTREDQQRRMAYLDHFKLVHGFKAFDMKRASFSTAKIVPLNSRNKVFWRNNYAINQRLYSSYHCQGKNAGYYVENLNSFKPHSLDGLPSAIYEVARYIIKNKAALNFEPVAIFSTAETLLPHYKRCIEEAFQCPVRDQYASSEGAPFIAECIKGNLHYCMDTGIIEVDDSGEMLVTCFESHGTPLIRYRIGDTVVMDKAGKQCDCGSCFPVVQSIGGRNLDYVMSRSNGKFTSIYLSLVSGDFGNTVKNMQFIQNRIDEIMVLLEVDPNYTESMNEIILKKLNYNIGQDIKYTIKIVDEIEKDKSGKFRFIINNVKE